jgi:hypothetical protein
MKIPINNFDQSPVPHDNFLNIHSSAADAQQRY